MENNCITNRIMLNALKIARITTILKKSGADGEQLKNFRPVSKLMKKCITVQLNQYLNDYSLLAEFQSAYKIAHSTETLLMKVQSDISVSPDNAKAVVLVFLDMSKVFDTLNHKILLSRLSESLRIKGMAL